MSMLDRLPVSRPTAVGLAIGVSCSILLVISEGVRSVDALIVLVVVFPILGVILANLCVAVPQMWRDMRRTSQAARQARRSARGGHGVRAALRQLRPGPVEIGGGALGLLAGAWVGLADSVLAALVFAVVTAFCGVLLGIAVGTLLPERLEIRQAWELQRDSAIAVLLGATALLIVSAGSGSDQLAVTPFLGGLIGLGLFLCGAEIVGTLVEEAPTGRSTRRHALAIEIVPAEVHAGEWVSVSVRLRGKAGAATPKVELVLRTYRMVIGQNGREERADEAVVGIGRVVPSASGRFATAIRVPDESAPSTVTDQLITAWAIRAELAIPGRPDPRVEAPVTVAAETFARPPETRRVGSSDLDFSLDRSVTNAGAVVSGRVGPLEASSPESVGVSLVRDIWVAAGPGAQDVFAGPVPPDCDGRFRLHVPGEAGTSPSAYAALGSVQWFVRAETTARDGDGSSVMREMRVTRKPDRSTSTDVGFPPRAQATAVNVLIVLLGLGFAAGHEWLGNKVQRDKLALEEEKLDLIKRSQDAAQEAISDLVDRGPLTAPQLTIPPTPGLSTSPSLDPPSLRKFRRDFREFREDFPSLDPSP